MNLKEKITHARKTGIRNKELPFRSFAELFNKRRSKSDLYLTYLDTDLSRIDLTYRDFCTHVKRAAGFLRQSGLQKGDRVATIAHNHWMTAIQYFACWLAGLVVVPVNLGEDDERIRYILEKGEVKLAFIHSDYSDRIGSLLNEAGNSVKLKPVVYKNDPSLFESDDISSEFTSNLDGEALIVFTSGTTGPPKAVVLTLKNLLEDAKAISEWHRISDSVKMMCVLPVHHVNGTVVTLLTPFYSGGAVVLNRKFKTENFFPVIRSEKVEIVSVVPTLLQFLNSYYESKQTPDTAPLKHLICGAGPLTVNTAETFEKKFGVRIIHGYGLSETTCYSCFVPTGIPEKDHQKWRSRFGYPSIGTPLPVNDMQIHDPHGRELAENERGEIVIRGYNVMKGYYDNKEANEEAFKNGWFRSGDEGFYVIDSEKQPYFFITGRLKELIIRGGVNLSPLEIDEIINKAPGVQSGIAVGFENDWYGEEVGAYIKKEEGSDADEKSILSFCRDRLTFEKSPKVVVFGDKIPVTSTGKYQRIKVAHKFRMWKNKQFSE